MKNAVVLVGSLCIACAAVAGEGFDHRWNQDESGIWSRPNQKAVQRLSGIAVLGGALYEGSDTRLGRTFWKATEAMVATDIAAEGLKEITRRARPDQGNNPNDWFGPSKHRSFPSGEVAHISAVVTPFIAEYAHDYPAVWGLTLLPAYVGAARLKSQAHWQSDVLVGAALGAGIGYYEYTRESPFMVSVLPRGVTIGLRKQF